MSRLLLHICCAPCSIYPLSKLKENNFEVVGFFYNPNIYPEEEFIKRRDSLYEFSRRENLEVIYFEYLPEDFLSRISPSLPSQKRCPFCWEMRLFKTASFAKENNFEYFSTTLLISPFQGQEKIKEIALSIQRETGVKFFFQDFREGFRDSHKKAKEFGLYLQKYCGCLYSKLEREEKILQWKR